MEVETPVQAIDARQSHVILAVRLWLLVAGGLWQGARHWPKGSARSSMPWCASDTSPGSGGRPRLCL